MYAIVDIAGQQFKVEKGSQIFVNRLAAEEGSSVDFDKVLLTDNDGNARVEFYNNSFSTRFTVTGAGITASGIPYVLNQNW